MTNFNRTILELKQLQTTTDLEQLVDFNRTILELKQI